MAKLLGQFLLLWKKETWGAELLPMRHEPSRKLNGAYYEVGDNYVLPDGTQATVACILLDDPGEGNGLLTSLLCQMTNATGSYKTECAAAVALSRVLQRAYNQGSRDADDRAKKAIEALKVEREKAMVEQERDKTNLVVTIKVLQDQLAAAQKPKEIMLREFREIVADFVARSPKHRKILAHGLGVSLPTVDRWAKGENAPHENLRLPVAKLIRGHAHACTCDK